MPSLEISPALLRAANIDPTTGLATDFLNHFNEALMLIGMLPDAPDLLDDLADWRPTSYLGHFVGSGFQHRDVVVVAYEDVAPSLRAAFDAAADALNVRVDAAIGELMALAAQSQPLSERASAISGELTMEVARLDALIHGRAEPNAAQTAVDALFN